MKKGGKFDQGCKKIDIFCNPVSRFSLILSKILFTAFEKWFFFVKVTPQEELKCKNEQFLQWSLKEDDVYFNIITASFIWGYSFILKKRFFYTTCCRRHIASLGHNGLMLKCMAIYGDQGVIPHLHNGENLGIKIKHKKPYTSSWTKGEFWMNSTQLFHIQCLQNY